MAGAGAQAGAEGGVRPRRVSTKKAGDVDRDARRITDDLAVLHDRHHDGSIRLTAIMQDMAASEIDDEVMAQAGDAEVIGKLSGLVEIAGRGREYLDDDDGVR